MTSQLILNATFLYINANSASFNFSIWISEVQKPVTGSQSKRNNKSNNKPARAEKSISRIFY